MFSLFGKLAKKKTGKSPATEEVKCTCGLVVVAVECELEGVYLCRGCNKLVYLSYPSMDDKVIPLSLAWLKKLF